MTGSTPVAQVTIYGLRVVSQLPLHMDRPMTGNGRPDVFIRAGDEIEPNDQKPAGEILVHLAIDKAYYTFTRTDDGGHVLRFYGACDFVVTPDLREVTVHVVAGSDPGLASVLSTGVLLSFLLLVMGEPVLHASAVQIGSSALAFVGSSGMGKSTMAALLCADGGRLITDDVLRLDLGAAPPRCHLGATELRLRKSASELASRFSESPGRRVTSDDRDALRLVESVEDYLPLRAIVVPIPDRERVAVNLTRLAPKDALLKLLRFPRILGWENAVALNSQLEHLAQIVREVPVYTAHVPWGPPFVDTIGPTLLEGVGLDGSGSPPLKEVAATVSGIRTNVEQPGSRSS